MSVRFSSSAGAVVCRALIALLTITTPAVVFGGVPTRLTILERSVVQDQGSWRIEYTLRHDGANGIVVTPAEILLKLEGSVSNSRIASHAVPRCSSVVVSGSSASGLSGMSELIPSGDDEKVCRERVTVRVWTGDEPPAEPVKLAHRTAPPEPEKTLTLAPGALVHVRFRVEHQHFLYGDYDPLLGNRTVELRLATAMLNDSLPMDREQYFALPKYTWPTPPEDRRDPRYFISAPDSLHIEAHVPGNQSYRFPERPIRYATKMRLRFWYLVAPGTEDECRARITQYKDSPTAQRALNEGSHEICLKTVGRWTKVERVFRTEPEATTLLLEFRVCGVNEVGEVWIDDVSLEPVVTTTAGP